MSGKRFLPETRDGGELQDDEQPVLGSILSNLHSLKLCRDGVTMGMDFGWYAPLGEFLLAHERKVYLMEANRSEAILKPTEVHNPTAQHLPRASRSGAFKPAVINHFKECTERTEFIRIELWFAFGSSCGAWRSEGLYTNSGLPIHMAMRQGYLTPCEQPDLASAGGQAQGTSRLDLGPPDILEL
ncbi:hypothetical protein F2Q69_00012403 [Brassica cretica]|uniref:Uncharacterized protein n=1 Tax=Brassica cretica TaxID=69181 RepID=A0A8S9R6H4_BRACR|nr:hypothetical protein F2Q69_00012403 [Brassica cretica]